MQIFTYLQQNCRFKITRTAHRLAFYTFPDEKPTLHNMLKVLQCFIDPTYAEKKLILFRFNFKIVLKSLLLSWQ